jgi:hypothetical protein
MSESLTMNISTGVTLRFANAGAARGHAQHLGILLAGLMETLVIATEYVDTEDMASALMIARDMVLEIIGADDCAVRAGLGSRTSAEVANA